MSELLEDLQRRLTGRYRIDRELGGGGMSRVFLAEELALGRRVVLKLPLPELAGALRGDRFEREVRLAAALQHPHIVPLLSAERVGDLVFYAMPFIEGESLRARLTRDRELPVPEAIRLLREVADALSHAHHRQIIHRDIKPDNILLCAGHAMVTDFGIAKALTVSDGTGAITSTGVSLGTPAYMAPEQALADAQVDQRADLYSLGVVGYEILVGETPFRGPSAQAIVGAQLTREATPIGELRPGTPPALAAAIHRCLEKRPADRFQSADELIAALDAISTGGADPTRVAGTAPRGSRTMLPRALGYFGVASAGVLAVAWMARTLGGLPDWFFVAVVLLLALGFPIVAIAALPPHRRVSGRSGPVGSFPAAVHHRLTIHNAVRGGVVTFALLAVGTAVYMAMRALGIGSAGSLVAAGRLNPRERLIIADFDNHTSDSLLGPAVTQAFRVDFSQSRLIVPVEGDYLRRVLRRMQRPDSTALSLAVAREVAQREGLKAVVGGEIRAVAGRFLISAQLIQSDSGTVLATARETAADSSAILEAVDRISATLRERIGESLRAIRASRPLEEVTTSSLDALRKYSQALRIADVRGNDQGGISLLEEAVEADTSFAMAWLKLGTILINSRQRLDRTYEAMTRAFRHRDRLTFRERRLTEANYYFAVTGDLDSATTVLRSLLVEYPNDGLALNNLGATLVRLNERTLAEIAYRQAGDADPDNLNNGTSLVELQLAGANFDSAAATLAKIRQRFPASANIDLYDVLTLLARRDYPTAETVTRAQLARYPTDQLAQARLYRILAGVLTIRGKLAEADRVLVTTSGLLAALGSNDRVLEQQARRAVPIAVYLDDRRRATEQFEATFRTSPLSALPPFGRPLRWLISFAVETGDQPRAEALVRELEAHPMTLPGFVRRWAVLFAQGEVLSLKKETLPQAIVTIYQGARDLDRGLVELSLAAAFDRSGMSDSALAHYEQWSRIGETLWGVGIYHIRDPVAYRRMAELYEARRDWAKAADFYGRFTELWREADPELQPKVRAAKRRLAAMLEEGRR